MRDCRAVSKPRVRKAMTIWGPIEFTRRWWVNAEERGFSPIDVGLGLRKNAHFSRGLRRRLSFLGAVDAQSFQAASAAIKELCGLAVDASEIERETVACGEQAFAGQQERDEAWAAPDPAGESHAEREHTTLVVSMDGVFVPRQSARRGPKKKDRGGESPPPQAQVIGVDEAAEADAEPESETPAPGCSKQRDQSSVYATEVKVAQVHGLDERTHTADGRPMLTDRGVVATHGSVEVLRRRLRALACRWGLRRARRVVVLGDGAAWIWITAALWLGAFVIEILDFWHAREYLVELEKALFGENQKWTEEMAAKLRAGQVRGVIIDLARMARKSSGTQREVICKTIRYFYNNRRRMRYPEYESQGLPIGSGQIESLGKNLVKSRLSGSGKRWEEPGLRSVLALRELHANQDWERFWEEDAQRLFQAA